MCTKRHIFTQLQPFMGCILIDAQPNVNTEHSTMCGIQRLVSLALSKMSISRCRCRINYVKDILIIASNRVESATGQIFEIY